MRSILKIFKYQVGGFEYVLVLNSILIVFRAACTKFVFITLRDKYYWKDNFYKHVLTNSCERAAYEWM